MATTESAPPNVLVKFYEQASDTTTTASFIELLTQEEIKRYRTAVAASSTTAKTRCALLEFSYERTLRYLRHTPTSRTELREFVANTPHSTSTLDPLIYPFYVRADLVSHTPVALYAVQCAEQIVVLVLLRPYARHSVVADTLLYVSAPRLYEPTVYRVSGVPSPERLRTAFVMLSVDPQQLRALLPDARKKAARAHNWQELYNALRPQFTLEVLLQLLQFYAAEHFSDTDAVRRRETTTAHAVAEPTQLITLCTDAASGVRYLDSVSSIYPLPRATLLERELHVTADGAMVSSGNDTTLQLTSAAAPLNKWMRRVWYVHPLKINVEHYRTLHQQQRQALLDALTKELSASFNSLYLEDTRAAPVAVGVDATLTLDEAVLRLLFGAVFVAGQHASMAVVALDELRESPLPESLFARVAAAEPVAVSLATAVSNAFSIYSERIAQFGTDGGGSAPRLVHVAPRSTDQLAPSASAPRSATLTNAAPLLVSRAVSCVYVVALDVVAEHKPPPPSPTERAPRAPEHYAAQIREMTRLWRNWPADEDAEALKRLATAIVQMRNTLRALLRQRLGVTRSAELTHDRERQLAELLVRTKELDLFTTAATTADPLLPPLIQPLRVHTYERVVLLNKLGTALSEEGRRWIAETLLYTNLTPPDWTLHELIMTMDATQLSDTLTMARALSAEEKRDEAECSVEAWLRKYGGGNKALGAPLRDVYAEVQRRYSHDSAVMAQLGGVRIALLHSEHDTLSYNEIVHAERQTGASSPPSLSEHLFPQHVAARHWRWSSPMTLKELQMVTHCEPELVPPITELSDRSVVGDTCTEEYAYLGDLPPDTQLGSAYAELRKKRTDALAQWRARMRVRIALFWSEAEAKRRVALRQFPLMADAEAEAVPTATAMLSDLAAMGVAAAAAPVQDEKSAEQLAKLRDTDALMLHIVRYKPLDDKAVPEVLRKFYADRDVLQMLTAQAHLVMSSKAWSTLLGDDTRRARLQAAAEEIDESIAFLNEQLVLTVNRYRDQVLMKLVGDAQPPPSLSALAAVQSPLESVRAAVAALDLGTYLDSYEQTTRTTAARISAHIEQRIGAATRHLGHLPPHMVAPLHARARAAHATLHVAAHSHAVSRIAMLQHVGAELPHTAADSAVHDALKPLQRTLDTLEHDILRTRLHHHHRRTWGAHPVIAELIGATVERSPTTQAAGEDRRLRDLLKALGARPDPQPASPNEPMSLSTAHNAVVSYVQRTFPTHERQRAALFLWSLYAWWFSVVDVPTDSGAAAAAAEQRIKGVVDALAEIPRYSTSQLSAQWMLVRAPITQTLLYEAFDTMAPQKRFVRHTTTLYLRLFAAHYVGASTVSEQYEAARNELARVLMDAQLPPKLEEFRAALIEEAQFRADPLLPADRQQRQQLFRSKSFEQRFTELYAEISSDTDLAGALNAFGRMAYDSIQALTETHPDVQPYVESMMRLVAVLSGLPAVPYSVSSPSSDDPRQQPQQLRSEDLLREKRTKTQLAFFRPDPREAGMLSAALNTFFCAEIDPRRDVTSLARDVWHDRLAALHAEVEREPFGTGTVSRGLTAAQKRARILGRWTPSDVAEAAVHLAMDQLAARGPASISAMPLAVVARALSALIGHAEFVRWLRHYGLDAHAYTDKTQRPPFRNVVTLARRQAGRAVVEVDELTARELYNALLDQEGHGMNGASERFMRLAALSYDMPANEAHDLWRLVVFGSLRDPSAVLLDDGGGTAPGQLPMDTLDLQQQLLALIELHELLAKVVAAALSAEDKAAVQAFERQALLRAALYFTLTFLYAPEHSDNLFLLQVHPDGAVLYDSFHGDVVPYIARSVYGWPEWADEIVDAAAPGRQAAVAADPRGFGDVGGHMLRALDDQWLMRTNALLRGRQLKHVYSADEYSAALQQLLQLWHSLWAAMLDDTYGYGSRVRRTTLERVLLRYPRGPLPYKFTDLKAGQAMVFVRRRDIWLDISPLAGLDTSSSRHHGVPEGRDGAFAREHADFAPEPQFSYYEWRVGRQYYLRPAFAADNSVPLDPLRAPPTRRHTSLDFMRDYLLHNKDAYLHLRLPELLLPPNAPLFFTLEWLLRNPTPSSALVYAMKLNAPEIRSGEGLGVLRPVIAEAPRERLRQYERMRAQLDQLVTQWQEHYVKAGRAFQLDTRRPPDVAEELAKALEDYAASPRGGELHTSGLVQRIEVAARGVIEYGRYAERLAATVAPRVAADVAELSAQYGVASIDANVSRWLRIPALVVE